MSHYFLHRFFHSGGLGTFDQNQIPFLDYFFYRLPRFRRAGKFKNLESVKTASSGSFGDKFRFWADRKQKPDAFRSQHFPYPLMSAFGKSAQLLHIAQNGNSSFGRIFRQDFYGR